MYKIALVWACWAFAGHGQRVQSLAEQWQNGAASRSSHEVKASGRPSTISTRNPFETFTKLLLALSPSAAFRSFGQGAYSPTSKSVQVGSSQAVLDRVRSRDPLMFDIFNVGSSEVMVVGAIAYFVLGPKELFRLTQEIGKFSGQWQEFAMTARESLTGAGNVFSMDSFSPNKEFEIARKRAAGLPIEEEESFTDNLKDAMSKAKDYAGEAVKSLQDEVGNSLDDRADRYSKYKNNEDLPDWQTPTEDYVNPRWKTATEYPAELESLGRVKPVPTENVPASGEQSTDEVVLDTMIADARNELETLKAEKQMLALKRKQLEAAAERAQKAAEEQEEQEGAAKEDAKVEKDLVP